MANRRRGSGTSRRAGKVRASRVGRGAKSAAFLSEAARARLNKRLAPFLERTLDLTLTDNRSTIVYVRRRPHLLDARLHHMFVHAPNEIIRTLAAYLEQPDRESSKSLGDYIQTNQRRIRGVSGKPPVSRTLRTQGRVYDLVELYDKLNRDYFDDSVDARITWGPRRKVSGRRASIKMGSYSVEDRLIRIHPSLDSEEVPKYVVEWIIYHEMLHQVYDIERVNGRRRFHPPAFVKAEKEFAHYDRARRWEERNIDKLLAS